MDFNSSETETFGQALILAFLAILPQDSWEHHETGNGQGKVDDDVTSGHDDRVPYDVPGEGVSDAAHPLEHCVQGIGHDQEGQDVRQDRLQQDVGRHVPLHSEDQGLERNMRARVVVVIAVPHLSGVAASAVGVDVHVNGRYHTKNSLKSENRQNNPGKMLSNLSVQLGKVSCKIFLYMTTTYKYRWLIPALSPKYA